MTQVLKGDLVYTHDFMTFLYVISMNKDLRVIDIMKSIGHTASTQTVMFTNTAVDRGLAVRTRNKSNTLVNITPKGERYIKALEHCIGVLSED